MGYFFSKSIWVRRNPNKPEYSQNISAGAGTGLDPRLGFMYLLYVFTMRELEHTPWMLQPVIIYLCVLFLKMRKQKKAKKRTLKPFS